MKTKNVIGHMNAQKDAEQGFFRKWRILPRLCCLLLALLIWLLVMHVNGAARTELPPGFGETPTESVAQ